MLGHIKDLFRLRKERQQKRFFNNKKQPQTEEPIISEMKMRTNPPTSTTETNIKLLKKKKKELSTDNMTMVEKEDSKSTIFAADELANLLVEQDNKRRSHLPSYPGLERFVIIRKLGE